MVSADTPKQALAAQKRGARTFRVKTADAPFLQGEIECLADSKGMTCADCGLCNGSSGAPSVAITVHGSLAGRYVSQYEKIHAVNI
jgi:hypothetical protein